MRNIWTIARREYIHFFTSPLAYVVAFVILLTLGIMFALTVFIYTQNPLNGGFGGPQSGPDISNITGTFTFLLVLSVPALTMRLIADEHRMGTMELLLTAPVRDWELVVGKWLGSFLFLLTLIAITLIYPLILNGLESPGIDQRLMMSSYLGLILVSAAFLALGVGVSSLFTNQIAAFFVTLSIFVFLWWLVGFPSQYVPVGGDVFNYLSMQSHFYDSLNKGIINLSDIIYYLSLVALGLFVGSTAIETRRWN
ncbi:MAG TPA: ABC transporter permease [Anaerolineales bacterium]|jgi:ABC-2 type transport system permease protein|nr:ABC transporter permease [Anaerolineales bacterium]